MNFDKKAPYLALALVVITLVFSQIGIFDDKYKLDLNLLIQESENDAFLQLNEYSLSKTPRLQLSVSNSSEVNLSEEVTIFVDIYRSKDDQGEAEKWKTFDCPPNPDGCLVYFSDTSFPSESNHMTYYAKASLKNSDEKKFISNKVKAIFKK